MSSPESCPEVQRSERQELERLYPLISGCLEISKGRSQEGNNIKGKQGTESAWQDAHSTAHSY